MDIVLTLVLSAIIWVPLLCWLLGSIGDFFKNSVWGGKIVQNERDTLYREKKEFADEQKKQYEELNKEKQLLLNDRRTFEKEKTQFLKAVEDERIQLHDKIEKDRQVLFNKQKELTEKEKIIQEQTQSRPELAKIIVEYERKVDAFRAAQLLPRAPVASSTVSKIKEEKSRLLEELTKCRSQLQAYESAFPELLELKKLPISDMRPYASQLTLQKEKDSLQRKLELESPIIKEQLKAKEIELKTRIREAEQRLSDIEKACEESERIINERQAILNEQIQSHPEAAKILQLYEEAVDDERLRSLSYRAYKAAEIVSEIKKEKKQLVIEKNMYLAQLCFYESLFPWLEEFKEVPIEEAKEYVSSVSEDEGEYFRKWLSPEEYTKLGLQEKLQLALDRWQKRPKSDWQAGVDYERYIGYLYEEKGYIVEYSGALRGLEDMGRDLIATKEDRILVIQCKRWSQNKEIHEKHIFQLFGTTVLYSIQNPKCKVEALFVTTGKLSDTAKQCAEKLDIKLVYRNMDDYPMIKCNINRTTGEKIYHLPFDQQYDRIIIEPSQGEQYVMTVAEAESLGFRHAFKHFN